MPELRWFASSPHHHSFGEMQNHSTRTCETFQWDGVAERLIQTNGFSDETYISNFHIYAIGLTRMLSDVSLQLGVEIYRENYQLLWSFTPLKTLLDEIKQMKIMKNVKYWGNN